ncbi:TonB-dependent siderophore receptor [Achromobacter xylosoxidans]|uniref:TonB-dependent siderophore receptor n=1 Tax=Alcaligenes xylosoxydans xylosoxydans TaxID=85698 RepID=UPI001F143CAA|nr:TonB-dependent receptor [Achromobacter xylosoxidans]
MPLTVLAAPLQAQTTAVAIAPGPLSAALSAYAARAGVLLSFDPALTRDLTTPGLNGSYGFEEGLRQLLQGSGLEPVRRADGGYTLRRAPASNVTALPAVTVTGSRDGDAPSEGTGSYTTRVATSATRMDLSLRETPQSVSVVTRQQMDDQNLVTLDDVMRQTPGIVADKIDERVIFTSRGFALSTMIDGVPTFSFKTPAAEIGMVNTVIYDRIEVLRGAAGLLNGVGEPGGAVNLIRKRPTPEFSGHVTAGAGRWNLYNLEMDVGGPLNSSGSLRGRAIASRTAGNSFIDDRKRSDDVFYGILEADLASSTMLSLGLEHQKTAIDGANFGQIPLFNTDGTRTDFPRSFNPGTPWSQWDMYSDKIFVTLDHRFANGWRVKLDASHLRNERRAIWGYLKTTGDAVIEIRDNPATSTNKSLDLYAAGPFQAFGMEHQAALGVSVNDYTSELNLNSANPNGWDRRPLDLSQLRGFPRPTRFHTFFNTFLDAKETAIYGSARLKLAEPLSLVLGGRATWYEEKSSSYNGPAKLWSTSPTAKTNGEFTPYAGTVFDLNDAFSAYASYTQIFIPRSERDSSNTLLPPQTGKNYELGVKGEHLHGKLNTSFAVFRTQEANVPVEDPGGTPLPDGSTPYRSVAGARSKGFEVTVAGEVARGLQVMGGYTYFAKRDNDGTLLLTNYPQRLFRLATSYRLPGAWNRLTVGGSLNYQSGIHYDEAAGLGRVSQGGVALLGLMAKFEFNRQLAASINIENLTDKRYYSGLGEYNGYNYGTPRNVWMKVNYKF